MFAEPYIYENTKVVLDVNGYEFMANGNVPVSLGWKQVDQNIDEKKMVMTKVCHYQSL